MRRLCCLLYRQKVAQGIAIVVGAYLAYYLVWRATSTLNPEAMWLSILLLLAEAGGFLIYCLYALMTWDTEVRPRFELRNGLSVDVFVPTYNEDVDILEATLTGCNGITYPHTTYVLDDGRRPQVLALAQRMGCRYLTRENNRHAKAGNINAALPQTSGDFIVVLDADAIPQPDFLDRTLGYFADERVALVQLPQEFYNVDSAQHPAAETVRGWHEQALFYRVIQAGKNRWNAAFWCGSPAVLRREALLDVGGVATETVTEDIHTSMRLHARGWRTVYHNESLAFGVAPETLAAFGTQRLRWAQGAMQMLRRGREILSVWPRLTMVQRLNYIGSVLAYFESFQKLIFLMIPSIILITGLLPMSVDGPSFFVRWLAYYVAGAVANTALGRGHYNFVRIEVYNLLKMFTFLWASTVLVWPRKLSFKVTPKGKGGLNSTREWSSVRLHLISLGALALTLAVGLANIRWSLTASYDRLDVVLVAIFWACLNMGFMTLAVIEGVRRLHRRHSYRFAVRTEAEIIAPDLQGLVARTEDLSLQGVGLRLAGNAASVGHACVLAPGEHIDVRLQLFDREISLPATVTRYSEKGGECFVGARFRELAARERKELLRFLFVSVPRVQAAEAGRCPAPTVVGTSLPEAA